MRVKNIFVLVFLYLPFVFSFANTEEKPNYIPVFSIDNRIHNLSFQSEAEQLNTKSLLAAMSFDFNQFNPAEKYLYFMILANGVQGISKPYGVIEYLMQAKALESQINQEQLNSFPFINLYKKLAQSYASIGQYKKAYDAKSYFIKQYGNLLKNERSKHIFELEVKYETNRKKDNTTLLNNQMALKALEINKSLNNEVIQRRNIYIVGVFIVVFLLLLIRLFLMSKRIKNLSKEDMLTGVCNRSTLFTNGKNLIKNCIDQHIGVCLLAISIDNFKQLNETHGDYIADEVLKRFALLGAESMRTRDMFSRLEDATFIAILPEASTGEAKAIAQHLKNKIANFEFNYVGIQQEIKTSVSITELNESLNSFELLLNTGINILHEIKDSGGNHVKVHQPYS